MQEMQIPSLSREDSLEEEMATHSSILTWKIPWTEEPGGLQAMGSQRGSHDWATEHMCSLYVNGQAALRGCLVTVLRPDLLLSSVLKGKVRLQEFSSLHQLAHFASFEP